MNPLQLIVAGLNHMLVVLLTHFEGPKHGLIRFTLEQLQTGLHTLEAVCAERISDLETQIDKLETEIYTLKNKLYEYESPYGLHAAAKREITELQEQLKAFRVAAGTDPNTLSAVEVNYAERGMVINAIKANRERTGSGLKEAKDAIEAYMQANKLGRFAEAEQEKVPVVVSPVVAS